MEGVSKQIFIIENELGFHARAANLFVRTVNKFSSNVKVCRAGTNRWVDGKSIMGVLTLAATKGSQIEVRIEGRDHNRAIVAVSKLIKNKFGENE